MNINEMWSKANGFQLNCVVSYDYVNTEIFTYFKLELLYRLLNRLIVVSVNDIDEVFSSFSATLLPIQEDYTHAGLNLNFIRTKKKITSMPV